MAICDNCRTEIPDYRAMVMFRTDTIAQTPEGNSSIFVRSTLLVACSQPCAEVLIARIREQLPQKAEQQADAERATANEQTQTDG